MITEPADESRKSAGPAGGTGAKEATGSARSAMRRAGRSVMGAAADKAGAGVKGVASRSDRVARGTGRSAARGIATTAATATDTATTATDTAKGATTTIAGAAVKPIVRGVGAGFTLVVYKIMQILRFLRQLALQLLEVLRQLTLRLEQVAARLRGGGQEAPGDEAAEGA